MMPRTSASVSLHTPPGRGGIAVIILTGPGAADILHAAFRPAASHADAPNGALRLGWLFDAGETIDEAIVCLAPGGIEVNVHGGPAVAARVMELFARLGAKALPAPAASGGMFPIAHPEMNNPAIGMELLEAMPKVRSAKVLAAVAQQWSGGISALAGRFLLPDDGIERADPKSFAAAAEGLVAMRRLLEPAEVVLAGAPNAGKSTLANALAGRRVSIVHAAAGTTRDWVRQTVLLDDIPIHLTDTAGLWEPPVETKNLSSDIDAEAVRRARMRACRADLVVLLLEAGRSFDAPAWLSGRGVLKAAGKCDLHQPGGTYDVAISALTGEGMGELRLAILRRLGLDGFRPLVPRAFTARQAQLLNEIARAIRHQDASAARNGCAELLGR